MSVPRSLRCACQRHRIYGIRLGGRGRRRSLSPSHRRRDARDRSAAESVCPRIFSLARGYGLALAFVFGSIAFLATAVKEIPLARRGRRLAWAVALAAGAVFANLAFLNYFLPFLSFTAVMRLHNRGTSADGAVRLRDLWSRIVGPLAWLTVVSLYGCRDLDSPTARRVVLRRSNWILAGHG